MLNTTRKCQGQQKVERPTAWRIRPEDMWSQSEVPDYNGDTCVDSSVEIDNPQRGEEEKEPSGAEVQLVALEKKLKSVLEKIGSGTWRREGSILQRLQLGGSAGAHLDRGV